MSVLLTPTANEEIFQFGADHVPAEGVTETTEYPFGMTSFTTTLFATLGPLLVRVIVKVILLPTVGESELATFSTSRSVLQIVGTKNTAAVVIVPTFPLVAPLAVNSVTAAELEFPLAPPFTVLTELSVVTSRAITPPPPPPPGPSDSLLPMI